MSEKTEKPTRYKLDKLKKQGVVCKSKELNFFSLLLGFSIAIYFYIEYFFSALMLFFKHLLISSYQLHWSHHTVIQLFDLIRISLIKAWLFIFSISSLFLIISSLLQTGFIFSLYPLQPKFTRFHPVQNLKRIFNVSHWGQSIISFCKLVLVMSVFFAWFKVKQAGIFSLPILHPSTVMANTLVLMRQFGLVILCSLFFLALIDKQIATKKYLKDQKMSKQEIKDEFRQRESDPKVKQKIRHLQLQLRRKLASFAQVKSADVVITNPTHLAVALKYDRATMFAPKLICKGQDRQIRYIKKIAHRYSIPIIENKLLARALYQDVPLNGWIKLEHFAATAKIYRLINHQQ